MTGKFGIVVVGAFVLVVVLSVVREAPASVNAVEMCPPVTLEDLKPPSPEPTTTTTDVPDDSTEEGSPSTTVPVETTTTVTGSPSPEPTTTTTDVPDDSTEEGSPSTTVPVETTTTVTEPSCSPFVYEMTYPLAVRGRIISVFGDQRDGGERLHEGVDLAAPKLTAVVATRDGFVTQIHNQVGTDDCCWLVIRHRDGLQSWYIHLNNDNYGSDDGFGVGVRIDLEVDDPVVEGEVLGWLGDSGNAENTNSPHLHYELRNADGVPVDARESLRKASATMPRWEKASGAYLDDDLSFYEWVPEILAARGVLWACDDLGSLSCLHENVSPEQLAELVGLLIGVETPLLEGSYQAVDLLEIDNRSRFVIGQNLGCGEAEECRTLGVTERDLARLASGILKYRFGFEDLFLGLSRVVPVDLTLPSPPEAVSYLIEGGNVGACELPLDAGQLLDRGRAAYLLLAWIGDVEAWACPPSNMLFR
jgi:murein DD-endopeptidase MepM/ murein hydrolase activator NlpD